MKAYELAAHDGLDGLKPTSLPEPKPGPNEVLVRMRAASLNYRDLAFAGAFSQQAQSDPLVPLSDGAGEVVEVGSAVQRVQVGNRVAAAFMQRWIAGPFMPGVEKSALGGPYPGVLAEYVVFNEEGLVRLPGHLSYEEGSTLPCAGVTAWCALFESGSLKPGQSVLLQGTGGVSLFALQFAALAGAQIVITSSSDEKLDRAKSLARVETINYRSTPDWGTRTRELTDGHGADQVIEVGGAGTFEKSLSAVAMGGQITLVGMLAGAGEINPRKISGALATVRSIYVGSRSSFEAMNRAISLNQLHPVIDTVFPFEDAKAAFRHLLSAQHFGKIVVRIG